MLSGVQPSNSSSEDETLSLPAEVMPVFPPVQDAISAADAAKQAARIIDKNFFILFLPDFDASRFLLRFRCVFASLRYVLPRSVAFLLRFVTFHFPTRADFIILF